MLKHLALLMYSAMLFVGGWQQAQEPGGRAQRARTSGLPVTDDLVRLSGWGMIAASAALQLAPLRRFAALSLAAQLLPITYVGHRFWDEDDSTQRRQHLTHFFKNLSIIGGALYIAATADD